MTANRETTGPESACPQCGAAPEQGETCLDRFHELLIFDFQDPGYGVVHHLVVLTYMTQHADQLTDEGFAYNRGMLAAFSAGELRSSLLQQQAEGRRTAREGFDGPARVLRRVPEPRIRTRWQRTVFDVDFGTGGDYRRTVQDWARSVALDLDRVAPRNTT